MALRPSRAVSLIAGCAALAGVAAAAPALASGDQDGARATIAGTTPAWATPAAKVGDADAHTQRHVQVALAMRDQAGAEALARAISTPGSPQYRKTLSGDQFTQRFAATQDTVERVSTWLRSQGLKVTGVSANRHFVDATASTGTLEAAFGTPLQTFRHTVKGRSMRLVAPQHAISVPASLRSAVTGVLGLDDSDKLLTPMHVSQPAAAAAAGDTCARSWGATVNTSVPQRYADQSNALCGYTTAATRAMYGLTPANTGAGRSIGIVVAYNNSTALADTNRAAADFGSPPLAASQYAVVPPKGGYNVDPDCAPDSWAGEQNLDVQSAHTMAPAAKIVTYAASDCRTLYTALNQAVVDNQVDVISNSFGNDGGEAGVPAATRQQVDAIGVQAAIQGQSLLVSSGDAGDSSGVVGKPTASFPASDPWFTAVGGTSVAMDASNHKVFDTGWSSTALTQSGSGWAPTSDADGPFAGGSGGGVSTVYDRPDYQQGVVSGTHRAVPDISALADAYTGFAVGLTVSGQGYVEYSSGGTSLASPLLAGIVADAAQTAGGRIGFLNPALYELRSTSAISDVTHHASGVWSPHVIGYGGVSVPSADGSYFVDFDAKPQSLQSAPGYDNETGVGTPAPGFVTALAQ